MEKLNGKNSTMVIIDDPIIERGTEIHREFERLLAGHAAPAKWSSNLIREGSFITIDRGDADRMTAIIERIRKNEILIIDEVFYDPIGIQEFIHNHYKNMPVPELRVQEPLPAKKSHHQQPAWRRQGKRRGQWR